MKLKTILASAFLLIGGVSLWAQSSPTINLSFSGVASGVDYTAQGSTPTGGKTYVLYNQTGKFLYNDGVTPRVSSSNVTFYTLETTGNEFYIRSEAGLLYKQSNSNWNTWTDGSYGDGAKWAASLSDGKYKLQNHNKAANNYYFAPNNNSENVQCYSDKTSQTGWYFIDMSNTNLAVSLLYALKQAVAAHYDNAVESTAKVNFGNALNSVYETYVAASPFTSDTYTAGAEAIQTAIDNYYVEKFASLTGSEGGEDITSWIVNPTPTSNGTGWTVSDGAGYDSSNNDAEFWNKSAHSLSQTIDLPVGYYRLTVVALTRTGMSAPLAVSGDISGSLNSMNITTVASGVVNNLGQANSWFNKGFGVNELDFYVPSKQKVTISLTTDNTTGDHWMVWRSFNLTAVGGEESNLLNLEQYLDNAAISRANAAIDASHVTGDEYTNLNSAVSALSSYSGTGTVAEKIDGRKALKYAIVDPYNTLVSAKSAYDEYYYENETATRLGSDVSAISAPSTAAEATTAAHAINVINYEFLENKGFEDVSLTVLGSWIDDNVTARNDQHWSGAGSYFEQNTGWNTTTRWEMSRQQTVALSAGSYVLKVAARASSGADAELSVKVGDNDPIVTYAGHHGDSGLGITTAGEACYISHDADNSKVYANSNNGRGFEWRYIPFTLDSDGSVTLKFYAVNTTGAIYQYVSFCNLGIWTDPAVAAKTDLLTAINNATTTKNDYHSNVGAGLFQIPSSAETILVGAISAAQDIYDDDHATKDEVIEATATMNGAITTYLSSTLNPPSPSTHYNLVVATDGHAKEGNAVVASLGATGENNPSGYSFNASDAPATYLAQAVTFISAGDLEHPNRYYITFEVPAGTLYLTNGTNNGSTAGHKASQIQGNTDSSKKMGFDITPSTVVNGFHIYNSETITAVACEDGGSLYTNGTETDFVLTDATQASVPVTILSDVKYATRIFPFAPTLPDGIVAYTCELATDGLSLELSEVDAPVANVPYILYAENGYTGAALTGWGTAANSSYSVDMLTGTYETIPAPNGSYILQNGDEGIGFYKVDTSIAEPNVPANRAYLTVGGGVKAYFFGGETVIKNVFDGVAAGEIYDLNGTKVAKMQPGKAYIVNGTSVIVK